MHDRADATHAVRTLYRTTLKAMRALGTPSLSMFVMLLDLFVARQEERAVSVSGLCVASGAAQTTALRQIGQMEARGLIVRQSDERDRRRCWVSLTPTGLALIDSLVDELNATA